MPMLRLMPGATSTLAHEFGGRLRPWPSDLTSTGITHSAGRDAAGAGACSFAQKFAQRPHAGSLGGITPPGDQPVWKTTAIRGLVRAPLKKGQFATSEANTSTCVASDPRHAAPTKQFSIHA